MQRQFYRCFIAASRKIDACCDPILESFGIDFRRYNLSKYYPLGIFLLVLGFYISVTYLVWIRYIDLTIFSICYYLLACFFMILCLISLYQATIRDPGSVDKTYVKENLMLRNHLSEQNLKFCNLCHTLKHFKTHHCSRCKKCVINLDHHCVWTNNCVGYKNRKFFNLLLFYGSVALIMSGISGLSIIQSLYQETTVEDLNFLTLFRLWTTFALTLSCIGNGIFLFKFFLEHFRNVLNGQTTFDKKFNINENYQKTNKGKWTNFKKIYGENIVMCFLPFGEISNIEFEELTIEFDNDLKIIQMT